MDNQDWTVEKSVERWVRLRVASLYAKESLRSIRREGGNLITFFGADRAVRSIRPEEMMTYLQWRADGMRASSAGTMFTYVKAWIEFCRNSDTGIRGDLAANWRRLKVPPADQTFVPPEAIPRVFDVAGRRTPRDRALLVICWYTGLRAAEIVSLTVGDVDMRAGIITARRSKVKDVKRVPMEAELVTELDRWLRFYGSIVRGGLTPDRPLIPAMGSGFAFGMVMPTPLAQRGMRDVTRKVLTEAGFEGRSLGTHTFRRSAGSTMHDRLIEEGDADPLGKVGILLGHHSRQSTEKYLNRGHNEATARVMAKRGLLSVRAETVSTVSHATVTDIRSRRRFAG